MICALTIRLNMLRLDRIFRQQNCLFVRWRAALDSGDEATADRIDGKVYALIARTNRIMAQNDRLFGYAMAKQAREAA